MGDFLRELAENSINSTIKGMVEKGVPEEEIVKRIENRTEPAVEAMLKEAVKDMSNFMHEHMYEAARELEAQDAEFLAHQEQKWGKCFVASRTMYIMATESAQLFSEYVAEEITGADFQEKQFTFLALQHIHGRACQEFLEILTLMKEGFADGAYARWRSMYELCCIADFIKEHGELIAKQYYDHSEIEGRSYDWTKGVNDNDGKPVKTFAQVQKMCNVDQKWKDQYDLGCLVTHASPQGTFGRMANGCSTGMIPVGRSDYGITTPAEHSAIALSWVTSIYLSLFPSLDGAAHIGVLNNWVDIIRELYFSTHDLVFQELIEDGTIKPLWNEKTDEEKSIPESTPDC